MPVLPVTSSSPAPADAAARGADAAAPTDAPAFSNVLSQQRDGAAGRATESRRPDKADGRTDGAGGRVNGARGRADADAAERREPLGPDETLSLILDSAALPLMTQAAAENRPLQTDRPDAAASPRAARLPADAAAGRTAAPLAAHGDARSDVRVLAPDPDARTASAAHPAEAGTDGRNQAARTDTAVSHAAAAASRTPLQADTAAPAAQGPGRARTAAAAQAQAQTQAHAQSAHQPQSAGQALAAQAAGTRVVESSVSVRPDAGPDTSQAAAPNAAALASAAAPTSAALLPAAAPAANPAAAPVAVSTPLSSPQWPQDFSRQVLQLAQNLTGAGHTVQMHVNPPELGPIHITLHVGESIAQASFVSPHANVRQALENALPHLEQQLAQAGLSLGQADVGDQQPGQQAQGQGQAPSARNGTAVFSLDGQSAETASLPAAASAPRSAARPDALVDTFA
ncbi:flagellar hook-length control protein FliK [Castellaniella defragrans]|nr:flagellar hook-length control protein FliK [Castellaniella defragrans]